MGLWTEAQSQATVEWASRTFWQQLFAKYIFAEKNFLVAADEPPSPADPRRRVDLVVRELGRKEPSVLIFIESKKPKATKKDLDDVESQALDACAT